METTEKQETALIPTLQLTPFEQTKENLIALASDYKNMVVTKDNMKEADKARLVLKNARLGISKTATANRKTIKEFLKNNNDATEEELIGTIEPTELALEAKIKAIKDAIAEEERIEALRVAKHKETLDKIKEEIVNATNSVNMLYLKTINHTVLADLEEFTAEGEQLLSTLKETAKNRLELLEFQEAKRKQEEAAAQKLIDDEKAKKDLEEKEAQKGFDMAEPPTLIEVIGELQEQCFETKLKIDGAIAESQKLSPLKTVPIGAGSEYFKENNQLTDKEMLKDMSIFLEGFCVPEFKSKEALQHGNYVRNMLIKLSEQTLKVAEKL